MERDVDRSDQPTRNEPGIEQDQEIVPGTPNDPGTGVGGSDGSQSHEPGSSTPDALESAAIGSETSGPETVADPRAVQEARRLAARQVLELHDLLDLVRSKRRLLLLNFWVGLLRGLGFFLGMTIVGVVLIGLLAFLFDWVADRVGLNDLNTRSVVQTLVDKYYEVTDVVDQIKEQRHRRPGDAAEPASGDQAEPARGALIRQGPESKGDGKSSGGAESSEENGEGGREGG